MGVFARLPQHRLNAASKQRMASRDEVRVTVRPRTK
jgi:hypothetical protein